MTMTTDGQPNLYEEGAATEDPITTTGIDALPPGVHPMDPSSFSGDPLAAPQDTPDPKWTTTTKPQFGTENGDATATFQRSDHEWTGNRIVVDTNNAGTVQLCGRQKGRSSVTLIVPLTATAGVVIGPTEGEVLNSASCPVLTPGQTLTLPTEAPIWAGVIPGQTTGTVDVFVTFNPAGGGLGGQ